MKTRIRMRKLLKENTQRLKREKEQYEQFISSNQKNGGRIVGVEKIEERKFYDTRWLITFQGKSGIENVIVVRCDLEDLTGMCKALDALSDYSRESICSLDERNEIYYD